MTREKLRVISPGGISLLRLIQGLVVRMPIPHLVPGRGLNRDGRGRWRKSDKDGTEGGRRIQYEARPQRIKHPSVLIFLVSYTEDRRDVSPYTRHIRTHRARRVWRRHGRPLMAKFSIRQTSVRGNGSSFSRATEDRARQEVDFNRGKRKWEGHPHRKGSFRQCEQGSSLARSNLTSCNRTESIKIYRKTTPKIRILLVLHLRLYVC